MKESQKWSNRVVRAGMVMIAFAYPHLIDDFLYGVPEEFGLTDPQTQVLAGIFSIILFTAFIAAARGVRWGYADTAFIGGFLALAVLLKHVPLMLQPGPYWSGLFSETLNWGLLVTSLGLMVISLLAIRSQAAIPPPSPQGREGLL